ncbi:mechanosensitive ion channel [Aliiglaciecola sp.]|nr:mechanosensitive ion channel [Aliiglaciecola sp.]
MLKTDSLINIVTAFIPLTLTLIGVVVGLWIAHVILIKRHAELGNEKLFSRQLIMLGLTLIAILLVVLAMPVSDSSRNQIIGLVGLVISGIFAFSSSTIFANLLAGIMLRITKPFRTGDFIKVSDYFGRVVERGLLDTEIQTESRDLVALPNTFMITHPITVTRASGTIISTNLSLGYDVHHGDLENPLIEAATLSGLTDAFVHIVELGDFAVTYKVSGKLDEVKSLISARTELNRQVLDVLHGKDIEIVSPSFVNQRRIADDSKIIPTSVAPKMPESKTSAEEVMFDKAEAAEQKETEVEELKKQLVELEEALKTAVDQQKQQIKDKISILSEKIKTLTNKQIETETNA